MNDFSFSLTIDEFAAAIFLSGKQNEARGLMRLVTGEIPPQEERGRFLAANNSLFRRKLISLENDQVKPDQSLDLMLNIVFGGEKLVRSNKGESSREKISTYYFFKGEWLEHEIENNIIHNFNFPFDIVGAKKRLSAFFSPICPEVVVDPISVDLPPEVIIGMDHKDRQSYDKVFKVFASVPSNKQSTKMLAEDISAGIWRGSTVFINQSSSTTISTMGALWIQGKDRLWMVHSSPNHETLHYKATLVGSKEMLIYFDALFQYS